MRLISHHEKGLNAELKAIRYLQAQRYTILGHRVLSRYGEIDILASRNHCLIAIEVKLRQSFYDARTCITPRQRQHIENALLYFVSQHPSYKDYSLRMDVILFVGSEHIHIENAWV